MDESSEFDRKKLTLFGVNLLSSDDIEEYFNNANFKVKKIFWLNDFSCKFILLNIGVVEFDSEAIALETYEYFTEEKIDNSSTDLKNFDWRKSKSFTINEKDQEILIRVSEKNDLSKKSDKNEAVYYRFYNKRMKNNDDHRHKKV